MFRNIPSTITAIRKALREAKEKYDGVIALLGTPAFSVDTYNRLIAFYPGFNTQIIEMDAATLEFSLDGFTTQTFPIDVHEGGEITQDVALVAV
jgi:hypothetical protein